jgi:hypothetical protein
MQIVLLVVLENSLMQFIPHILLIRLMEVKESDTIHEDVTKVHNLLHYVSRTITLVLSIHDCNG